MGKPEAAELPQWAKIQKKTFTNWVNVHLADRGMKLDDLATDLNDGVKLINLLEIISAKKFGRYNKTTKFQSQKLENVGAALKFLKDEGIKLVAIGPEDVVEQRIKLILGLIWTIILRWQIQKIQDNGEKGGDAKAELIAWVNSVIPHCPVKNLKKDWQDGKALAALTNYLKENSVDENESDELKLVTAAVNAAEQEAGVPAVISPEDIVSPDLDELSMMTYVAMFRDKDAQRRNADPAQFEAYGPGLKNPVAGKRNQFTVVAKNANGERLHIGGLPINSHFVVENSLDTVPSKVRDAKDGTYAVHYVPRAAGEYLVHVNLDKTPIKDSPFRVNVREPVPIDVSKSTVDPNISEKERENENGPRVYYTTAITRDANGDRIPHGGAAIVANVIPHSGRDEIISIVEDLEDGSYEIYFNQPPAGKYKVQVGLPDSGGEKVSQHLTNSPFNFGITADGEIESDVPLPAAGNTTVEGDGVEKGKTDKPSAFKIHARDANGKSIPALPEHFVATVTDPSGNQSSVPLTPEGDKLVGSYTPTNPGDHQVAVSVAAIRKTPETPVKDSPFTVPVKASADASRTELSGPGITETDAPVTTGPSQYTIKSVDKDGNPLTEGGEDVDVTATGPDGSVVKLNPKDNGDGTYTVEYAPEDAGKHVISAKVDGKDINNSPAEIEILDAPSGENTSVEGDGVKKGKTDKPSKFKVHAKNAKGKTIPANADLISASVTDPSGNKTPVELTSEDDALVGEYTPTTPGDYIVEVNVNDKGQQTPAKDSPFTVPVKASADASHTELSGPGITETDAPVTTGPSQYTIKSFDKNGNPLTEGGEDFDVSVTGPDGNSVKPDVKDNGDGTYTVEYAPEDAGEHTLSVKSDGQDVNNSPAVINIVDAPSSENTTVEGDGVEKGKTDKPSKFKVRAKDAKGKSIPANADLIKASVTDPSGNKTPIELKPDGDDLVGEYTPTTPGDYTVDVNVNDKGTETPVKDSPFSVPVKSSASPSHSELSGPGITDKEAFVTTTEPSFFTITSFDKEGNPLTEGGEEFEVTIKGPEGKVNPEVKDNGDGTYRVDYAPQEAGKHKISVTFDGHDVKNSPASIEVEEGTDEEETFAVDYMFTIEAKTKSGATRTRGGDKFEVVITSKEGVEVEGVKVEDLAAEEQPGRYRVWYTLPGPGKYSVKATLNGKNIKGSPWKQSL